MIDSRYEESCKTCEYYYLDSGIVYCSVTDSPIHQACDNCIAYKERNLLDKNIFQIGDICKILSGDYQDRLCLVLANNFDGDMTQIPVFVYEPMMKLPTDSYLYESVGIVDVDNISLITVLNYETLDI